MLRFDPVFPTVHIPSIHKTPIDFNPSKFVTEATNQMVNKKAGIITQYFRRWRYRACPWNAVPAVLRLSSASQKFPTVSGTLHPLASVKAFRKAPSLPIMIVLSPVIFVCCRCVRPSSQQLQRVSAGNETIGLSDWLTTVRHALYPRGVP